MSNREEVVSVIAAMRAHMFCNTEDPISFEALADIDRDKLYGLKVSNQTYGFDIDNLFDWLQKSHGMNPITNLPLLGWEKASIVGKYIDAHRQDGVIGVQVNTTKGWDHGLVVMMVGALNEWTLAELVPEILQLATSLGIDDFESAAPGFVYAGRIISPDSRLSDIAGFASGHKITLLPVVPQF
jgi:hypothetical protein